LLIWHGRQIYQIACLTEQAELIYKTLFDFSFAVAAERFASQQPATKKQGITAGFKIKS
jgi:hypothetical protein